MTVDDGPKVRIVQSVSLEDRIVLNAVMNVVDRHLKVRFIRTTSASIKNRGTHDLLPVSYTHLPDDNGAGTYACFRRYGSKYEVCK